MNERWGALSHRNTKCSSLLPFCSARTTKWGKLFTITTMKTRACLQTHPSVLLMWLSCHSKDTRKGQSERWLCDQSSMPAVPLVSMQERGRREGGVGRGGEVEGGVCHLYILPPGAPHPPPCPSLESPRVCPKREWQFWSQGLQHPQANKGRSVWAPAACCYPASSSGPPSTTAALQRLPVWAPPCIWTGTHTHQSVLQKSASGNITSCFLNFIPSGHRWRTK